MTPFRARRLPLLAVILLISACSPPPADGPPAAPSEAAAPGALQVVVLAEGDGPAIAAGSTAVVHYTGWLYDPVADEGKGTQFDSSRDRGQPFRFPLGAGRVIRGWDLGVEGMQAGERRRLIIPAALGYGERGAGGVIPPGATLVFDVELIGIE